MVNFLTDPKGNNAALVNSPGRIEMAKAAPFYTKCWYALRYFTTDRPRIGMRLITEKAVNDKMNCLADGEKYVLYLYDEKNEKIGAATLSLKEE